MESRERSFVDRRSVWLLLLVMALGIVLRAPATRRGFFHWDEAQYVFALQPAVLTIRDALGMERWPRPFVERAPFDRERDPYSSFTAKPTFDVLTIAWGTILGLTPTSVAGVSLLFSIGTILLLYLLVRRVFDDRLALTASLILAVSSYHVFFAGSQTPAAVAAFFLTLAVGLYLESLRQETPGRLALAGAALALAYGSHYNLIPYVTAVFGLEALHLAVDWRRSGARRVVRPAILGGSFLAVVGAFELFYRLLIPFAYASVPPGPGAYAAQLWFQHGFPRWATPSGASRFAQLILNSEGVLICGLAVAGWEAWLPTALRDRRIQTLTVLPAAHLAAATLGGAVSSPVFSRMIVALLPFVALWAACGAALAANAVARMLRSRPAIVQAAVVGLLAAIAIPKAYSLAHLKSGYAESAEYVLKYGGGKELALGLPLEQYYLGSFQNAHSLPISLEEVQRLHRDDGVRLLVLDHRVHIIDEWGNPLGRFVRELENRVTPVATIPNPMARTMVVAAENAMSRGALDRSLADPRAGEIRIYDLSKVLAAQ